MKSRTTHEARVQLVRIVLIYPMIGVMPFAFVNCFPARFLLRKRDMAEYPRSLYVSYAGHWYSDVSCGIRLLAIQYTVL